MKIAEVLDRIRKDVESEKAKGKTSIEIDVLISYVDQLNKAIDSSQEVNLFSLERWRIERELEQRDVFESNRLAVDAGQGAVRGATILNGAGAVAILAFVGNSLSSLDLHTRNGLVEALGWYAAGALVAAFAGGFAYLIQRFFFNAIVARKRPPGLEEPDSNGKGERRARLLDKIGESLNYLAIAVVIGSYVIFGVATSSTYSAFKDSPKTVPKPAISDPPSSPLLQPPPAPNDE